MDSELTPQQELAAAKARLRAMAGRVDASVATGRRLGTLLLLARRTPLLKYGAIAAVLLGYLGAGQLKGARGHLTRRS